MRNGVNVMLSCGAIFAFLAPLPAASAADPVGGEGGAPAQQGESQWVPSLAITSGVTLQKQQGAAETLLFPGGSPDPVPLRNPVDGEDLVVSPFVGAVLEIMSPALPVPGRPRLFASGEILPTFASERSVAIEGDPDCARGPEPDAPCARDEDGTRRRPFREDAANGQGTKTTARIGTLVYGASLGVAFPARLAGRQLRIKPSVSWISYEVEAEARVLDAACVPDIRCTDVTTGSGTDPGFLRETILRAQGSKRLHGIGPGLDVEVETGRFGPVGSAIFLGGRAYHVLGSREITMRDSRSFDDPVGMDRAEGRFSVDADAWMFRAHVGIRLEWLGSRH